MTRKDLACYIGIGLMVSVALALTSQAQTVPARVNFNTVFEMLPGYVPASATDLITQDVRVEYVYFANKSTSAVTCKISDKSTNCGGATCPFWPDVSILANQAYVVPINNIPAIGGFTWSCSTASAVVGYMRGKY